MKERNRHRALEQAAFIKERLKYKAQYPFDFALSNSCALVFKKHSHFVKKDGRRIRSLTLEKDGGRKIVIERVFGSRGDEAWFIFEEHSIANRYFDLYENGVFKVQHIKAYAYPLCEFLQADKTRKIFESAGAENVEVIAPEGLIIKHTLREQELMDIREKIINSKPKF